MDAAALNMTTQVLGHGRFLFLRLGPGKADAALVQSIEALGARLENMHFVDGPAREEAGRGGRFQYLAAAPALSRECDLTDEGIARANALIRLEGATVEPLAAYEDGLRALLTRHGGTMYALSGVQKPRSYTSHAMTQFAYAGARAPASGATHPFGVVTPQRKTSEWWAMDWMRRESFFLPRYDETGNIIARGHALACAAGIPCINRRLYHNAQGYGLATGYDFIGYFEFGENDRHVFQEVMDGLRDASQNPEWRYVREGPEWWGRRVGHARELWTDR